MFFGPQSSEARNLAYRNLLNILRFPGAQPKSIPIFETADEVTASKIIAFRTKEDFLELEENVNNPDVKNIVIVGGGFLGSELACSLARNRKFPTFK